MEMTLQDLGLIQDIVMTLAASEDRCTFIGHKYTTITNLNARIQTAMAGVKLEIKLVDDKKK